MPVGKLLIVSGLCLVLLGMVFSLGAKLPWHLGRLPGDIFIQKEKFTFAFPLTTCIILSFLFTLLASLISRFLRR